MTRLRIAPVLLLVLLLIVSGCDTNGASDQPRTVTGPTASIDGSDVHGWVRLDADDRPSALGLTIEDGAYEPLSDTADDHSKHDEAVVVELAFPDVAPAPFEHATLDWNPEGHPPPGIYTVPHFDVHFSQSRKRRANRSQGDRPQPFQPTRTCRPDTRRTA